MEILKNVLTRCGIRICQPESQCLLDEHSICVRKCLLIFKMAELNFSNLFWESSST
jgi:hypothetical protein